MGKVKYKKADQVVQKIYVMSFKERQKDKSEETLKAHTRDCY